MRCNQRKYYGKMIIQDSVGKGRNRKAETNE